jgi:hypothetical protein
LDPAAQGGELSGSRAKQGGELSKELLVSSGAAEADHDTAGILRQRSLFDQT